MRALKMIFAVAVVAGLVIGCASAPPAPTAGQRTVIQESGKMPDWVTHVPQDTSTMLYFRGFRTRALAYEDGLTDARMDAMRQVAERVQTVVHTSYEKARVEYGIAKDDQDAGRDLEDGIIAQAKAAVTGAKEKDAWWQEFTESSPERISYFYDVSILMELSKADFERSLDNTLQSAEQKSIAAKNKKASDVLARMRQDIKSNP